MEEEKLCIGILLFHQGTGFIGQKQLKRRPDCRAYDVTAPGGAVGQTNHTVSMDYGLSVD